MIQPIFVYGQHILEQPCTDIQLESPQLQNLVNNLWDTMRNAQGCGLSAPQIGLPYNVFVIDSQNAFQAIGKVFGKDILMPRTKESKGYLLILNSWRCLQKCGKQRRAASVCQV
jgi:peptide deformylase